jgi:hypothetical protein
MEFALKLKREISAPHDHFAELTYLKLRNFVDRDRVKRQLTERSFST